MAETRQSPTLGALFKALSTTQAAMRGALKDSNNPHLRSKYADLASVWDAWQESGPKNGLAIIQRAGAEAGWVHVCTLLGHESGEWLEGELRVPFEPQKGTNIAQALGSALTYARRYALAAMVGIAPEDDDGHGAAPAGGKKAEPEAPAKPAEPTITEGQWLELQSLANETADSKLSLRTLLAHFRAKRASEIPAKGFKEARDMLHRMRAPAPVNEEADVPEEIPM